MFYNSHPMNVSFFIAAIMGIYNISLKSGGVGGGLPKNISILNLDHYLILQMDNKIFQDVKKTVKEI